MHEVLK